jgi:enoyl-CoA hydratase/carnithine racemase
VLSLRGKYRLKAQFHFGLAQVDAKKAKKLGLVDEIVQHIGPGIAPSGDNTRRVLEDAAVKAAKALADGASGGGFMNYI